MSTLKEKLSVLSELSENEFRTEVLIPLIKRMGAENVRHRHGPDEYGKDITFVETTNISTSNIAVVAKIGNISGAASGRDNLDTVLSQVKMAFDVPFYQLGTKKEEKINRVIVWCTGNISRNAETRIKSLGNQYRNIDFKNGEATIELLEKYYPAFFTIRDPFVSDYFKGVKEVYSRLEEIRTLGASSERHPLPAIFVPPTLTPHEKIGVGDKKKSTLTTKDEITFFDLLKTNENIIITGMAGSGKTTLLRRLLLKIVENNEAALQIEPIPVFVEFRKIDFDKTEGIEDAIWAEFNRFSTESGENGEQEKTRDISESSIILLIDGLDELIDDEKKVEALGKISDYSEKNPNIRLIISSRQLDILKKPEEITISGFKRYRIKPLTRKQIGRFVKNWFGKENPTGNQLLRVLKDPSSLRGLPSTPFTLTLIALLFEGGASEIPANLTELFEKYVELALGRWDLTKNINLQIEWKVKQFILRKICWDIHEKYEVQIDQDYFLSEIQRLAMERGLRGLNIDTETFVREIVGRSELIFLNDANKFEFKHRAIKDYFVGLELANKANSVDIITKNFLDYWWTQAIFFACGLRPDSEDYIVAIIREVAIEDIEKINFGTNLGLLLQATYLAPIEFKLEVVNKVVKLLIEGWNHAAHYFEDIDLPDDIDAPFHVILLFLFTVTAQQALGSVTLSEPSSLIIDELLKTDETSLSERERTVMEWQVFILAMSSAFCGDYENFIKIFQSGRLKDLSMILIGKIFAEEVMKEEWMLKNTKDELDDLAKKLDRKVKRNKKYFQGLLKSGPIPLPNPTGEETED